jgi:potassium-transporting ATPase KdpC subunit
MQEQKASNPAVGHVRANLWLLVLSVVIGCVLYPGAVWVVGQLLFRNQAQGSLIDAKGEPTTDPAKAVGSKLIAQAFNSPVFFQPRPSAASYNAAASGGSNLGASSPKLRGRVAQLLGTISRYSKAYKDKHKKADGGEPVVQDDIVAWFKEQTNPMDAGKAKRDLFTEWANNNSTLAGQWATGTASIKDYILQWAKDHDDVVKDWKKDNSTVTTDPGADALVVYFFKSYAKDHFGMWPTVEGPNDVQAKIVAWAKDHPDVVKKWKAANPDAKDEPKDEGLVSFFYQDFAKNPKVWPVLEFGEIVDGDQKAVVKPDAQASDVESTFFDTWLTERVTVTKDLDPLTDLDQVPADMVTASGSSLDPDITLRNARYQEDGVVAANVQQIVGAYDNDEANKKVGKKTTDIQKTQVEAEIRRVVDKMLEEQSSQPMFGLTGDEPLVNVLQLNLALKAKMEALSVK